jgi:hypothetical protein
MLGVHNEKERTMVDFVYIVHYPIYADGVIQYDDAAFLDYDLALEFASRYDGVRVQKVEVF